MIEGKTVPMIENLLTWTAKRQQAIAANIANIDTPGYRATDYSFDAQLQALGGASTSDKHIASGAGSPTVRMYEPNTTIKPDGNSVSLERELTEMTKNGLQYMTLVQFLNQKLRMLRSSITEGGRV